MHIHTKQALCPLSSSQPSKTLLRAGRREHTLGFKESWDWVQYDEHICENPSMVSVHEDSNWELEPCNNKYRLLDCPVPYDSLPVTAFGLLYSELSEMGAKWTDQMRLEDFQQDDQRLFQKWWHDRDDEVFVPSWSFSILRSKTLCFLSKTLMVVEAILEMG